MNYHQILKYQKIKKVTQEEVQAFEMLLKRFSIEGIIIYKDEKVDKLTNAMLEKIRMSSYLSAVAGKRDVKKTLILNFSDEPLEAENGKYVLEKEDIFNILTNSEKITNDIPQIINTLENGYSKISIVGKNTYAEQLLNYLSGNKNIIVRSIPEETIQVKEGTYFINEKIQDDEIIIWAEFAPKYDLYDVSGIRAQVLFVKDLYKADLKTSNYLDDINYRIIPRMLASGVEVVKVYIPEGKRLERQKEIKAKQLYWKVYRKLSEDNFSQKRRKLGKTEYLKAEQERLVNNNSKGYSQVHGNGTYINFDNGFRRTIGNTPQEKPAVYVFGPCFVRGIEYEDKNTIPSMLKACLGDEYNVFNYGSEFHTVNYIMREVEYKAGDIVVLFTPEMVWEDPTHYDGVHYMDLTDTYNRIPHIEKHLYDMLEHFDMTVQKQIVEDLFHLIKCQCLNRKKETYSNEGLQFGSQLKRIPDFSFNKDVVFQKWLQELREMMPKGGKIGSIVMNCNPFTYGHRYLIETAASQVDYLWIFVVQEDKSVFPFDDRIRLVKAGTADLKNVIVVPSGNYMISSMTLPGYFEKDKLTDIKLDASGDLMLFLQIAKALDISIRFAGEEPLDPFTRQYNENMEKILPKYGLAFHVIKRKEVGDEVISASRVRRALQNQDFELIKRLVPKTTYDYLVNGNKF